MIRMGTLKDIRTNIKNLSEWKWAKTYEKTAPHWYIMGFKPSSMYYGILKFKEYIKKNGIAEKFFSKYYNVLIIGEYKYWVMGSYKHKSVSLNRAVYNQAKMR